MSKKHKKENQSETSNMATSEEITIETATPEKVVSENVIDFYRSFKPSSDKNIPFPSSYKVEPRVYIVEDVYNAIQEHSQETTDVELCGVLIGEVRFDEFGNYLYICGSIRGEKAKNSGVNVSFTYETWDYINEVKDEKYSNYSIIGWYHTHPGFGIFLSGMDKFIQDNYFNMPYQVALVVDPKASTNGIFAWQDGKIRSLKNCWIGDNVVALTTGTVGGEETFVETNEPQIKHSSLLSVEKKQVTEKDEKVDYKPSFYQQAFNCLLCFTLAFILANYFFTQTASNYAAKVAQTETKEILSSWAKDYSVSYELDNIIQYIEKYNSYLEQQPATFTLDIKSFKDFSLNIKSYLSSVSDNSKTSRNKAVELLKNISERNISIQEKAEQDMGYIKQMVANTIFMQIEPYLKSLSAQRLDSTDSRIKEAKKILNYILELCSNEEKTYIKQTYPWIFQD